MRRLAFAISALSAPAAAADGEWQTQPALYFGGEHADIDVTYIHQGPFGRGFETGFAVGRDCPEDRICNGGIEDIAVRVVRRRPETGQDGEPTYAWLETSLDACPAAYDRLKQLPEARWGPTMRTVFQPDRPAAQAQSITVTTYEGQVSVVTASAGERTEKGTLHLLSGEHVFRGSADGSGNPADWAEAFLRDIAPCLSPASAPPPWKR